VNEAEQTFGLTAFLSGKRRSGYLRAAAGRGGDLSGRRLRFFWGRLNSSFWFVPVVLKVASIALFFVTQAFDQVGVRDQHL
jgi:hypothetical protein